MIATLFQKAGGASERIVRRFMPDPFALVLLLTLVALVLGVALLPDPADAARSAPARVSEVVSIWTNGFGNAEILKFGFQIMLIVVTGEAIAESPSAKVLLREIAALPKTAPQALWIVTTFAVVAGWVHWGFGLVASALLARAVGRSFRARGVPLHYPLLGTGAYTAMLLWHAGITASAPLLMNTQKNFVSDVLGEKDGKVPLAQTIFAPYNLLACALLLVVVPLVIVAMHPRANIVEAELPGADEANESKDARKEERAKIETPAENLDKRRVLTFAVGALGLTFLWRYFREHGFDLNHNVVNCTFLMLGLVLHESPVAYARAIGKSVRGVAGIVLQFPFYGGILEVMTKCGISDRIALAFISLATAHTLPILTFAASILTKSFVPSGAGEWAVEGPPMLRAAKALGVPYGKITMAVAYGNMLGNMYQPFWSLPLLGVMGLKAKDIMGYCLVLFVIALPILACALYFG